MSTKQGYLQEHGTNNPLAPKTLDTLVKDTAKTQSLFATLANTPDKDALGYPAFSTVVNYEAGNIVYKDNKLYKFIVDHSAGAWNSEEVEPTSVKEEAGESTKQKLEDGLRVTAEAIAELWFNIKGLQENLQNYGYAMKVNNIDTANIPMVCGSPLVVEGRGAPSIFPMFVGQRYHDTTNNKCYEAFSVTGSTNDWKILN